MVPDRVVMTETTSTYLCPTQGGADAESSADASKRALREVEPSFTDRRGSENSNSSTDDDDSDGGGFGLDSLLPEPEKPIPPPYSYAVYNTPPNSSLDFESLQLPYGQKSVVTRLVGSHPLWGHHLWNTARVLTDYLVKNPQLVIGKRVVELGAGAALPSLVAILEGAEKVVMTDYPDRDLMDNIRWNVETNIPSSLLSKSAVEGFLWGANADELLSLAGTEAGSDQKTHSRRFDLVLLSDLVFNHSQHSALISSVESLISPDPPKPGEPTPCVLIFITHHRPHLVDADMAFLTSLAQSGDGWEYEQVVEEWAGAMFDEDPGDVRVRGTVKGFRAWRRHR